MPASLNKTFLIGNLTRDPITRDTNSGKKVCNFSIATNESYKDANGELQTKAQYHNIVAWGRTAEICGQYLSKGRSVFVEGRLEKEEWNDKEGNKRSDWKIHAHHVQFLGPPKDGAAAAAAAAAPAPAPGQPAAAPQDSPAPF